MRRRLGSRLFATWANLDCSYARDRVERYPFDELRPLVGLRPPEVDPVVVNLPKAVDLHSGPGWSAIHNPNPRGKVRLVPES